MKNILRKCKEQAVHGWTAGKDNSFFMMSLLPIPSSPVLSLSSGDVLHGTPWGLWVSAPDPIRLPFQGNSDKAERNAFQFASPQVDCKTIKQRCLL